MKHLSNVYAALRRKNIHHYLLLAGCCFFSVLLITAYICMMRSPTVLTVLPEGGDSRKQVMMIFVLAVIGCGVFSTYASGLFFRYKSRETGILLALGASRGQLKGQLKRELCLISLVSCGAGALLGAPLAWMLWQLFRAAVVDTQEMTLAFDPQAYVYALAFSVFVIAMLFLMLNRFIRRTNIMEVVNEARKSEPIHNVPNWYGPLGIVLLIGGGLLGYMVPSFCVLVLHWYPPDALSAITYLPALVGLYMILLHTVVNGWRRGKNRYQTIIGTSMMKFQGRQTVRNMLVITVLVAGAYFGAFYTPMLGTGAMMGYEARKVDYAFHYRSDQAMLTQEEIQQMADAHGVSITWYCAQPMARLGIDGEEEVETDGSLGTTYDIVYNELCASRLFLSESAYNALTGEAIDVAPGTLMSVYDDNGASNGMTSNSVTLVTNPITGQQLAVTSQETVLRSTMLFGYKVLDDGDYTAITQGLPDSWLEEQVFFNVENDAQTYAFAKALFHSIVAHSGPEVELFDSWDPVRKMIAEAKGEAYFLDPEYLVSSGFERIDYDQMDASTFRMYWQYMPQFRVLDQTEFIKTTAVFLMLFIFIAIICFAAVVIIAYTRSLTIALTNVQVYQDLRRLGANNRYLLKTVRNQISKVFFSPILTGTVIIFGFYMMIMFFNGDDGITAPELRGLLNCLILVLIISAVLYGVYRFTLDKVCRMLHIHTKADSAKDA